jgi:hypothetical protein
VATFLLLLWNGRLEKGFKLVEKEKEEWNTKILCEVVVLLG